MVQKICPICDQVMKSAHYCKHCKCRVKHPYVVEVTYRLNEEHPRQETDCNYHPVMPQAEPDRNVLPRLEQAHKSKTSSKKGALVVIGIVVFIKILTLFVGFVIDSASEVVDEVMQGVPEYDVDMGDYTAESWEDYAELTDDEVLKLGEACNTKGHFRIKGEELIAPALDRVKEAGYTVSSSDISSYNERHDNGETWYGTWTDITLTEEENPNDYQYLQFDYDTATGMLHEVKISLKNPGKLSEMSCMIMDLLIAQGEMEVYSESRIKIRAELFHAIEDKIGWQMERGGVRVEGISYDTRYIVTISHNMESNR